MYFRNNEKPLVGNKTLTKTEKQQVNRRLLRTVAAFVLNKSNITDRPYCARNDGDRAFEDRFKYCLEIATELGIFAIPIQREYINQIFDRDATPTAKLCGEALDLLSLCSLEDQIALRLHKRKDFTLDDLQVLAERLAGSKAEYEQSEADCKLGNIHSCKWNSLKSLAELILDSKPIYLLTFDFFPIKKVHENCVEIIDQLIDLAMLSLAEEEAEIEEIEDDPISDWDLQPDEPEIDEELRKKELEDESPNF